MSETMFRRGLLAPALLVGLAATAAAQQPATTQGFATADAAMDALVAALKRKDNKALASILGPWWLDFIPTSNRNFERSRATFLAAWDVNHKVSVEGDKAVVEVGTTGWTWPVPLKKDGAEWRFDARAGAREMVDREIGRNELGAIQTLLSIGDAQRDYAELNPMKTSAPAYARRLLSSPGRMDGLYWPPTAGRPESPLGAQLANSQPDGTAPGGHYGYNYRLLYAQGAAAAGGARDYIVGGRMIGGFAAIAWPAIYGVTGVMTFMVGPDDVVWQQDLGPDTTQRAASMTVFNPDQAWQKA
ncbi:MAG: DUF2950 family protein, partial [Reyranella sp.]